MLIVIRRAGSNEVRPAEKCKTLTGRVHYGDQEMLDILKLPMVYGSGKCADRGRYTWYIKAKG